MSPMLRELLVLESPYYSDRLKLSGALAHPWCWPHQESLRIAAARFADPPSAASPGEALLVSEAGPDRPALWRLRPPGSSGGRTVPLAGAALASLRLATRMVTRDLPILFASDHPVDGPWSVGRVFAPAGSGDVLDGASFGLSFVLAAASALARTPLPADAVASAAVNADGTLRPVSGLEEKLAVITGAALAVRRFVVEASQRMQVEAMVTRLGHPLEIIGVANVREALAALLPDLGGRTPESLADPADVLRAVRCAYRLALLGAAPLLAWRGVERACDLLGGRLAELRPQDHLASEQLDFARLVARRHGGLPALIPWPVGELANRLPETLRLRHFAHVVQSHIDASHPELASVVERARGVLASSHRCDSGELALLGALGRALPALGKAREGLDLLARAVAGWFDTFRVEESSRALCELVRLCGVHRDSERLERCRAWYQEFLTSPDTSHLSRAFLRLAVGRAEVLLGQPEAALASLADEGISWTLTPAHVQLSRRRWRARGLVLAGRAHEAIGERARLAEEAAGFDQDVAGKMAWLLVQLDMALETGEAPDPLLARLAAAALPGLAALLDPKLPAVAQARRLADEYPY